MIRIKTRKQLKEDLIRIIERNKIVDYKIMYSQGNITIKIINGKLGEYIQSIK